MSPSFFSFPSLSLSSVSLCVLFSRFSDFHDIIFCPLFFEMRDENFFMLPKRKRRKEKKKRGILKVHFSLKKAN